MRSTDVERPTDGNASDFGDMSEAEMTALYQHPKVKGMVSISHGEGFGLPLFEAGHR